MSKIKTLTSAITAAVLVSGIGLAVAQSEEQPADPSTSATPTMQTPPADANAMPLASDATVQQQQQPADDPTRSQPPADPSAPLPAQDPAQQQQVQPQPDSTMQPATSSYDQTTTEPAPRADRN